MLRHYLVLKKEGIPLFSFSNKTGDPHLENSGIFNDQTLNTSMIKNSTLFSGLMSSFVSFGKELGGSLKQIKLDNADLYMYEKQPVIGVAMADPSTDQDEISGYRQMTEVITSKFVEEYSENLEKWTGDVSQFDDFHQRVLNAGIFPDDLDPGKVCKKCLEFCCGDVSTDTLRKSVVNS